MKAAVKNALSKQKPFKPPPAATEFITHQQRTPIKLSLVENETINIHIPCEIFITAPRVERRRKKNKHR